MRIAFAQFATLFAIFVVLIFGEEDGNVICRFFTRRSQAYWRERYWRNELLSTKALLRLR